MQKILRCLMLLLCVTWAIPSYATVKKHRPKKALVARETVERSLPHMTLTEGGELAPVVHALSAIVYNPDTNEVLYELNGGDQRPIASITKVMTATVVLESDPDLSTKVTISPSDVKAASHTYLHANDKISVGDLLHLLLIGSDNAAARALARTSTYGSVGFVERMNTKALELGLFDTRYADPSGLLSENLSTVYDMAQLLTVSAESRYISSIMQLATYTAHTAKRVIHATTTDHLLMHPDLSVITAKTGYIHQSGYCLAAVLNVPNSATRYAIVVFGATSNAARFNEVQNLYRWMLARTNAVLRTSVQGLSFIRDQEGFHARPYFDHKGWAIGYGSHVWDGQPVTRKTPAITAEEADAALPDQMVRFERVVKQTVSAPLQQHEFDALVSVAYNLGRVNTTIRQAAAAGRAPTRRDFLSTATVKNHRYAPLVSRRSDEFSTFAGQDDK